MWTFYCIEPLSCNLDFFHNFHAIWGNKSLNIFWGKTDYQTNKLTFFNKNFPFIEHIKEGFTWPAFAQSNSRNTRIDFYKEKVMEFEQICKKN